MIKILLLVSLFNLFIILFYNKLITYFPIRDVADGEKKIHEGEIPILGGTILYFNFLIILFYDISFNTVDYFLTKNVLQLQISLLFGYTIIYLLGLYDDKKNLSPLIKFFLILVILLIIFANDNDLFIQSLKFSFLNYEYNLGSLSIFVTTLCFILFMNAFNMFDGINMQSITYSIVIFIFLAFIGFSYELPLLIVIILLFILYLNISNKLFMGDSGTLPFSFLISYLVVKAYNAEIIIFADKIFLLMLIPGLDLLRLSITRLYNGNNPFKGDRQHIHHLLNLKYGNNLSILILLLMICTPLILGEGLLGYKYSIILSILIYLFTIQHVRLK